jgi:hypothetical protein
MPNVYQTAQDNVLSYVNIRSLSARGAALSHTLTRKLGTHLFAAAARVFWSKRLGEGDLEEMNEDALDPSLTPIF